MSALHDKYYVVSNVLLAIPFVLLIAGMVFAFVGLRGRKVDNHPLCRHCGYDLIGSADAFCCPECGTILSAEGIILGHRQRRRRPLVIGLVLLVPGTGMLLALLVMNARGWDVDDLRPSRQRVAPDEPSSLPASTEAAAEKR